MTSDLEDVVSWPYIRHVNPLTVNIVAIRIPTAHRDTLVTHVIAGEPLLESYHTYMHTNIIKHNIKALFMPGSPSYF